MSAVLDLNKLRRTRRYPWDTPPLEEAMPNGTPAIDALMPRRVMDEPVAAQPNFTLDAPLTRTFSADPAPTTLQPPTPLRRTLSLTPEVEPMPATELQPLPDAALLAQRRYTRPTFQNTGNEAVDLTNYDRSLSQWKDPADRNGRLKSFGLGALRGLMQGLATGQGLGAGLGGAIAGGLHGAITPNADERAWRDEERARTEGQLGTLRERRLEDLKLRGLEAGVAKTEAERDALLNPRTKPNYQLKDAEDGSGVVAVDMNNPLAPVVKVPGVRGAATDYEVKDGTDPITGKPGVFAVNRHNPRDVVSLPFGAKAGPQMVKRTLSDGTVVEVPASAALGADATVEGARIGAENTNADRQRSDVIDAQNREYEIKKQHYNEGKAVIDTYHAKRKELLDDYAAAKAIEKIPADKRSPEEEDRYNKIVERNKSLVAEVDLLHNKAAQYGDVAEDVNGVFTMKPQPTPPPVVSRPAVQSRRGAPSASTPKTVTAQSTEQEVREAARYYGRDEEAAVEKWRKLKQ